MSLFEHILKYYGYTKDHGEILIGTLVIINITRKRLGNIILIPCKRARYDFTII